MGIGDGWMSPYHNARYANQLYQVTPINVFILMSFCTTDNLNRLDLWTSGITNIVCLSSKTLKISSTEDNCEWGNFENIDFSSLKISDNNVS